MPALCCSNKFTTGAFLMIDTKLVETDSDKLIELSTEIVVAYVGNNSITSHALPEVISTVYSTMKGLQQIEAAIHKKNSGKPAVPIKKSITDDYIICLEDGKKLKMMKRYLRSRYDMSPQEYRSKWGLPADYPMVSPNYAARRSDFAKKNGLGKKH